MANKAAALLLTVLLLSAFVRSAAAADPATPGWLLDVMTGLAAIRERHATFREEKRFAALDTPLVSQGWLIYRRPAHLEKITTAPDPESLVVDGDTLTLAANREAPRSFRLGRRPEVDALVEAVRGALAGDLGVLESHYRISAEGRLAAWHLVLQPTDPGVQRLVRTIAIDGAGTDIQGFRTVQTNGDEQIMTITTRP
jgi:outer membrane lipoprotein-sorting protein